MIKKPNSIKFNQLSKGSTIYFALMITIIILAIGLGLTAIIINQMKLARGTGDSVIALYAADTGIEQILFELSDDVFIDPECNPCSDTLINGASYEVTAVRGNVSETDDCPEKANWCITSQGVYKNVKRAIMVNRGMPPHKKVFIVSQDSNIRCKGDLDDCCNFYFPGECPVPDVSGIPAADRICQMVAESAGLGNNYLAWISDDTTSPDARFNKSDIPYRLLDGTLVAYDWSDLVDGQLEAPINITELGAGLHAPNQFAWTDTNTDGTYDSINNNHCDNWGNKTNLFEGEIGNTTMTDSRWTIDPFVGPASCDSPEWIALYCFEQ